MKNWHEKYKPFGVERTTTLFGGMDLRLDYAAKKLEAYCMGNIETIEELDEDLQTSKTNLQNRVNEVKEGLETSSNNLQTQINNIKTTNTNLQNKITDVEENLEAVNILS